MRPAFSETRTQVRHEVSRAIEASCATITNSVWEEAAGDVVPSNGHGGPTSLA